MKIMIGDAASGLAMIESALDLDGKLAVTAGGDDDALDFLLMAAFGYQQVGNDVRANELLQAGATYIQRTIERGIGEYPKFMEVHALNLAMLGRTEEAVAVFDAAIDSGWRNYAFIVHDPRWQIFLSEPAVQSLMNFVKADIDRQRLQVEKIDADEDFRVEVDAILAISSRNSSP